ncbi:hypothetical protein COLO4_29558 [Corchorus olitorius]|uniref:RNase H type-1 domain-containing protein n=1 Tax=Corchorus olitorius TaxID=93759 RepID=A0A1R3HE19_9ROSI|nr:hypothetical protein COLO4_29558 [Corchorus olitorius]
MAEAYAVKKGIEIAIKRKLAKVIFETDCKEVQTAIPDPGISKNWRIEPIVRDIRALLDQILEQKLVWIRRSGNAAAHWAASEAVKGMCHSGWLRLPPSSLVFILDKDGVPAPPL